MPTWVTYLSLHMNPDSAPVPEIVEELKKNHWAPVWGDWDFAFEWSNGWNPGTTDGFWTTLASTQKVLQRLNVGWQFHTFEKGQENGRVWWSK